MHATIDRLASREIVGFLKKKTQRQWNLRGDPGGWAEEKNARTQGRKDARTQGRKDARTQGRKDAKTQRLWIYRGDRLSQREIEVGLEGFLGGIDRRVGVDLEAGRAIEFQFLVACDSVRDAPSVT